MGEPRGLRFLHAMLVVAQVLRTILERASVALRADAEVFVRLIMLGQAADRAVVKRFAGFRDSLKSRLHCPLAESHALEMSRPKNNRKLPIEASTKARRDQSPLMSTKA